MICPCKACTDREIGCHGECARYKEWRRMFEKERESRVKRLEAVDFLDRGAVRRMRKIKCGGWKRR